MRLNESKKKVLTNYLKSARITNPRNRKVDTKKQILNLKIMIKKLFFTSLVFLCMNLSFAQNDIKELKFGIPFTISVPNYMTRTIGLNSVACLQFKNSVKDVYGIIIEDSKEELTLAELNYASLTEFTEVFRKDFLKDEKSKVFTAFTQKKIGDVNFSEFDANYIDSENNTEIYYLVGLVETKSAFYKMLLWTSSPQKDIYKEDFRKILYSFKG